MELPCSLVHRSPVKAGVQGHLPENAGRIELIRAIRMVAKGGLYFVLSSS